MSSYPDGYYVYRLIDPRSGLPFYVGKGQRRRAWAHESAVRSGNLSGNAKKVSRIADIIGRGDAVVVEIVAAYDQEADALDHEFRLIDADPTLTNLIPGGIGGIVSPEAAARQVEARRLRVERARQRDRQRAFDRERERRRNRHLAFAQTSRQKEQIAAWLDGLEGKEAQSVLAPVMSARAEREAPKVPRRSRGRGSSLLRQMIEAQDALARS